MSILDDAIREHLELKRAHGADEAELKKLEDEAFGPAERPDAASDAVDPFAEAPTEFLTAPGAEPETGGRRLPNIADLQEPPPPKSAETEGEEATGDEAATAPDASAPEAPAQEPAQEEHPAAEHQIVATPAEEDTPAPASDALRPDPGAPGGPSAEERHEIADQPTEMFDVEQQLFEDTAESASPSDEQLIEAEQGEPTITPAPPEEEPEDEFDEFFSEQRLSDELNQALEAPLPDEPGAPPTDEGPSPFMDPEAELGPVPVVEPPVEEPTPEPEPPVDRTVEQSLPPAESADSEEPFQSHEPGHADALEDTPEFLEDAPEDDDAWFEQKPPKDFDFGD